MADERSSGPSGSLRRVALSLGAVLLAGVGTYLGLDGGESGGSDSSGEANGDTCALSSLPPEAAEVVERIEAGGPFEYPENDGTHFGNYEQLLPQRAKDYYREYTVATPGLNHRGPRRIVTGGEKPDVWYYTADHYESFCEMTGV
ncbi:Guanyl-specific ribonuclease St [Corynebacterium ciconiae DSM 44920]|uniref:ribonuclease domain-containing protein n=1 Tax=Corynebacterium ciconiae TaxID=227319 RepID=UPI0003707638|nr:ribonuclease domain-containing protein [Corynebacterium ciconiae]WKD60684.1 Guanyl-specific ribonuclease St [Corynebacterium ciconiae DSM 44920]